jgi:hypothetical protein
MIVFEDWYPPEQLLWFAISEDVASHCHAGIMTVVKVFPNIYVSIKQQVHVSLFL